MRFTAIFTVLAVVLIALCWYMASDVVNPLVESKVDEIVDLRGLTEPEQFYPEINKLVEQGIIKDYVATQRVALVIGVAIAGLVCAFIAIHTFIDKLFFKEFYRQPDLKLAVRRGILFGLGLIAIMLLHFIGIAWLPALLPIPLVVVIELLIMSFIRAHTHKNEPDIIEEPINQEDI